MLLFCVYRLQTEQESNPNLWFAELADKYHIENISTVAKFVHAKEDNIVLVENTTTGNIYEINYC